MPPVRRAALLLAGVGLVLGPAACGDDGPPEGGCGPARREALDPAYLVHVLADADDLEYLSDPPTSGPHQPGPELEPVVTEPLPRPVQVGLLEQGAVLLQYDPEALDDADLDVLEGLAGDRVVVAPAPGLSEPVIATAWVFSLRCDGVDAEALEAFIDERRGQGPEG